MKVKIGTLTKIRTGKLDANASSEDGQYPFFTCSKEALRISSYSYDCECVLIAGNGDLNVKYYNGKFDAYQRTYIIEDNSDGKLYMPYLYYFMEGYIDELRKQAIGGVIKYIKLGNLTNALIDLPSMDKQKDVVNILEMLNNAKTIQEYSIIISQKLRELEISDKYLLSMDNNGFEFIGTSLIGNEYSVDTIKNFYDDMAVYSACYNLSSLKTGKEVLECAEYYQDKIKLTENKLYADFLSLNNENKVNVFSLFKGRQIHDLFELNNVFEDSVILTIINSSESYGMLHNCLLKYESYLPFSLSEYKACDTTKISRYLFKINTGFKTMDELKDRIAEAVRESKKETSDYGSGSGSGSGSSSSPIKKIEVTNTETKEPINTVSMFNDVPKSHWAYENILALQKNRIVNGNEKNLFEPEKNITREEFVKIVDIVLNVLDENAECDFDDVDKNAWYYKYVASAKKLGIVDGIENNKFGVGEFITREDMAVIISRAYNLESETNSSFNDESLISDYAKSPVAALANAKIIDGFQDGTFRPKAFATRAEAAKIIYCLIK